MAKYSEGSDTTVKPIKPELFDKRVLNSEKWKPYIYEINFSGKKMRDLKAEGYLHAAYPFIDDINMELVKFEESSVGTTKPYRLAVVRCKLTLAFTIGDTTFEHKFTTTAYGDGDTREVKDPTALVRIVETRALKRAIARALDISRTAFDEAADVEEVGTPLQDSVSNKNPLARALDESRENIRKMQSGGSVTPADPNTITVQSNESGESDW